MSDKVKQDEMEKAMEELDQIAKSATEQTTEDALDELTKALEEELGEELEKASKCKPNDENDDENDEDEEYEKSMNDGFEEELVKASEAYADLEKSVNAGFYGLAEEIASMKKAIASNINLNVKMAAVISALSKSLSAVEGLTKSVQELSKSPTTPNSAVLSIAGNMEMKKSKSEIQDELLKAVQEGKIAAHNLSVFATYKDVNRLPEDVRQIIGC